MDFSNLFYIFNFATIVISIYLGFYCLYRKTLGKVSISFAAYSFIVSVIAITSYISYSAHNIDVARISIKISNISIMFSMPALFLFTANLIQMTISRLKPFFKFLFYVPAIIVGVWLWFQKPEIVQTVNYGFLSTQNEFMILSPAYIAPFSIAVIIYLIVGLIRNTRIRIFSGSLIFLLVGTIFSFLGSAVYVLLYSAKIIDIFPLPSMMYFFQYIISFVVIITLEMNLRSYSYKKLLANLSDATILLDEYGSIIDINEKMFEILKPSEAGSKNTSVFNSDYLKKLLLQRTGDTKKIKSIFDTLSIRDNSSFSDEITLMVKNKEQRYYNVLISPISIKKGISIGKFAIFKDITEYKIRENKLRYLSYHDTLTGLYNRTFMEEEFKNIDVETQLPLSIVIGDINGLRIINDSYGHQKGDEILRRIANILKENFKHSDIISRWGGDEFLVLLPKTSIENTDNVIRRIKTECKQKSTFELPLSISLGVSIKISSEQEINTVIKDAEGSMYSFKFEDQRSIHSSIITSLEKTLEEKDLETGNHAKRLKEIALKIGKELNLSDRHLNELSLLSGLHDLGKVSIPEGILSKPGKLTPGEWEIVKKHPEAGYRIASAIDKLAPIAEAILYHHEKWDGTGYPLGLKGLKIPLTARIINIVDSYDAMTHKRVYKDAKTKREAVEELKKCSGTQFDPQLVKIMIRILR